MPFGHQAAFSRTSLMKKYGFDTKYKICADRNFFYVVHKNNAKFEYIDLTISNYEAEEGISFITSTKPCVVMKMEGTFKAEMIFPVTPQYCIRFIGNKLAGNRSGKFYEIKSSDVKVINRKIISESKNIVMSDSKIISDRI